MVFSDFRDSVGEIVAALSEYRPKIRASPFIGQASTSAAKGNQGEDKGAGRKGHIGRVLDRSKG